MQKSKNWRGFCFTAKKENSFQGREIFKGEGLRMKKQKGYLYEVRIYDGEGNLKEVVMPQSSKHRRGCLICCLPMALAKFTRTKVSFTAHLLRDSHQQRKLECCVCPGQRAWGRKGNDSQKLLDVLWAKGHLLALPSSTLWLSSTDMKKENEPYTRVHTLRPPSRKWKRTKWHWDLYRVQ